MFNLVPVTFEEYLISKKIDSAAFRLAEPHVWQSWKTEFEQQHPNSFTVQKLNLINPIRRKYLLKIPFQDTSSANSKVEEETNKPAAKPAIAKPVFKPRPKI